MAENEKNKHVRIVNRIGFIGGYFVGLAATIIMNSELDRYRLIQSVLVFTVGWVIGSLVLMRIARSSRENP